MPIIRKIISRGALLAAALAALSVPGHTQDPAAFYKGRTIAIVMGTGPGGSYDLYGRVIARHLGRHIPGNPNIIVEHMPGGGGANAGNFIFGPAPQDGSKILESHALPLVEMLTPGKAIRFKSQKFQWLGAFDEIVQVMALWHTAGVKSLDELQASPVVIGSMGTTHLSYQWASLLKNATGAKFRVISGYGSGGALNIAMERGEIAGWTVSWENLAGGHPDWLRDNKVSILAVFALQRTKELPNVPTMIEIAKGEMRDVAEFLTAGTPIARGMAVGPNVPVDRVAALRKAFDDTMKDPAFLADAAKRNLSIGPRNAAEVGKLVDKIVSAPPALIARVKAAVSPAGAEKLKPTNKPTK